MSAAARSEMREGGAVSWDMNVGDVDTRTAIQARHGGSPSRGISAPAGGHGPVDIMFWWRPEHGALYGYADGWAEDGAFYFTGTGQLGDQRFEAPNAENGRVRDHQLNGDRLRLLRYVRKNNVRYVGEFALDPVDPWQWRDGLDALGHTRKMIQFRMLPVGEVEKYEADVDRKSESSVTAEPLAAVPPEPEETDVEALKKKEFQRLLKAREQIVRREESELVHRFRSWLTSEHGIGATGLRIPTGTGLPSLRADLWIPSREVLVEAKSSSAREHIRTAIGQLLDYVRHLSGDPTMCVLLPTEPASDMLDLLESLSIACVWAEKGAFESHPGDYLTS